MIHYAKHLYSRHPPFPFDIREMLSLLSLLSVPSIPLLLFSSRPLPAFAVRYCHVQSESASLRLAVAAQSDDEIRCRAAMTRAETSNRRDGISIESGKSRNQTSTPLSSHPSSSSPSPSPSSTLFGTLTLPLPTTLGISCGFLLTRYVNRSV